MLLCLWKSFKYLQSRLFWLDHDDLSQVLAIWLEGFVLGTLLNYMVTFMGHLASSFLHSIELMYRQVDKNPVAEAHKKQLIDLHQVTF